MGVQAATTTRLSSLFDDLGHGHLGILGAGKEILRNKATLGKRLGVAPTSGTLTMPPMLMPQLQTKTPIGASSGFTVTSGGAPGSWSGSSATRSGSAHCRRGGRGLHDGLGDILGTLKGAADVNARAGTKLPAPPTRCR